MKSLRTLTSLFILLWLGPMVMGQDDTMGAFMRAVEMHNEANNQGGDDAHQGSEELSDEERRRREEWQAEWEEKMKNNEEFLSTLDNDQKCIALMVLFLNEHFTLINQAEEAENCKLKHDLYGLALLNLSGSTTIMYCTEDILSLSVFQRMDLFYDFFTLFFEKGQDGRWQYKNEGLPILNQNFAIKFLFVLYQLSPAILGEREYNDFGRDSFEGITEKMINFFIQLDF